MLALAGTEEDYMLDDSPKYLPLCRSCESDNVIRTRHNRDVVIVDARGKELLKLCIENELRIMNGRCIGDI
jgi:hypothetical protein